MGAFSPIYTTQLYYYKQFQKYTSNTSSCKTTHSALVIPTPSPLINAWILQLGIVCHLFDIQVRFHMRLAGLDLVIGKESLACH